MEKTIFETKNFIVKAFEKPHVSRNDGGHIIIFPKKRMKERSEMAPEKAVELSRLTMIVGKAMQIGMNKRGVKIERINYQDNGNWIPEFHLHIYGRAKNAKFQLFGEALNLPKPNTGFYGGFEPLNNEDIKEIKKQIEKVSAEEKFKEKNWQLAKN